MDEKREPPLNSFAKFPDNSKLIAIFPDMPYPDFPISGFNSI